MHKCSGRLLTVHLARKLRENQVFVSAEWYYYIEGKMPLKLALLDAVLRKNSNSAASGQKVIHGGYQASSKGRGEGVRTRRTESRYSEVENLGIGRITSAAGWVKQVVVAETERHLLIVLGKDVEARAEIERI